MAGKARLLTYGTEGESTMERHKTKLGARILSESELEVILPNAESVYEQIEVFRSNIPEKNGPVEQKTNNIGIMGSRGTGKTSVLKTFHENLKSRARKDGKHNGRGTDGDIILPIIVPENMSPGATLMDVVLGMLKPVMEEREDSKAAESGDCIYSGRDSLEKLYNKLIKQYCYIKKDYRNILIQQFTTEQYYLDKTKEVFNSDSEFIDLFDRFVTRLLRNENESGENAMIFLFIDDIDLSADRCMDVVRTLLSYLSHPRIVTFISGDIQIFEEALTLEFLRQEQALDDKVFREVYFSAGEGDNNRLLERKKTLAYEYLKKILPPAYRRSIKYWSLEERGKYRISEGGGNTQKSLADLLVDVSGERLGKTYFVYSEDGRKKTLSPAFHMFDETSRGLNNVYNVLQELCDLKVKEEDTREDKAELSLWRLIETLVDSSLLYAKHKEYLLKKIIVLGQEQVRIHFENAYQWLYPEEAKKGARMLPSKERFAVFFLIDFAAGLFSRQHGENEEYINLKNKVMQEYLSDENIDDRIAAQRDMLPLICERENKNSKQKPVSVQSVLLSLLKQGDFIFALHLVRCLGREEIYNILKNDGKQWRSDREIAYKVAGALAKTVRAINETEEGRRNYLANLYLRMPDAMLGLFDMLSLDPKIIYGRHLTDNVKIETRGIRFIADNPRNLAWENYENIENYVHEGSLFYSNSKQANLLWAEYENRNLRYWMYFESCLREKSNTELNIFGRLDEQIALSLTKTVMNWLQDAGVMDKYKVKRLGEIDYDSLLSIENGKLARERQVIKQIDEDGLWNTSYAKEKIFGYLDNERTSIVFELCRGRIILDGTELLTGAYAALEGCEKGSSGKALINGLVKKVRKVLSLSTGAEKGKERSFADGKYYLRLEQALIIQCLLEEFLQIHYRARYGKKEMRELLMKIKELPVFAHTSEWNAINVELEEREDNFFTENENGLKDDMIKELEARGLLESAMQNIGTEYYNDRQKGSPSLMEFLAGNNELYLLEDNIYFRYLLQKKQIEKLKKEREVKMIKWENIEPVISKEADLFIFHSYLRYLQSNDRDAEKAGAQAEEVATLAGYMLEGEIIADQKVENEVYEIIGKKLELTEEEFETLFLKGRA